MSNLNNEKILNIKKEDWDKINCDIRDYLNMNINACKAFMSKCKKLKNGTATFEEFTVGPNDRKLKDVCVPPQTALEYLDILEFIFSKMNYLVSVDNNNFYFEIENEEIFLHKNDIVVHYNKNEIAWVQHHAGIHHSLKVCVTPSNRCFAASSDRCANECSGHNAHYTENTCCDYKSDNLLPSDIKDYLDRAYYSENKKTIESLSKYENTFIKHILKEYDAKNSEKKLKNEMVEFFQSLIIDTENGDGFWWSKLDKSVVPFCKRYWKDSIPTSGRCFYTKRCYGQCNGCPIKTKTGYAACCKAPINELTNYNYFTDSNGVRDRKGLTKVLKEHVEFLKNI